MYALRLFYQRHRKLAPFAVAMVALFFVTLITTMPMPGMRSQPTLAPVATPTIREVVPAGDLALLLADEGLETLGEAHLAFTPARGSL